MLVPSVAMKIPLISDVLMQNWFDAGMLPPARPAHKGSIKVLKIARVMKAARMPVLLTLTTIWLVSAPYSRP